MFASEADSELTAAILANGVVARIDMVLFGRIVVVVFVRIDMVLVRIETVLFGRTDETVARVVDDVSAAWVNEDKMIKQKRASCKEIV